MTTFDAYQQLIGAPMSGWSARPLPSHTPLAGLYCRLGLLGAACHAGALFAMFNEAQDNRVWTYMVEGPFIDIATYRAYIERIAAKRDPLQYTVIDVHNDRPVGTPALIRITPEHDAAEVGAVTPSPLLQRTSVPTEAQFPLMKHVFEDLGYRRYEWKCDSLNASSWQTTQRLGFQFEGTFRQAVVYKDRNRDTAWFSTINADWPQARAAFEQWLSPENSDEDGRQRASLAVLRSA